MTKHKKIMLIIVAVVIVSIFIGSSVTVLARKYMDRSDEFNEITEVVLSADELTSYVNGEEKTLNKASVDSILENMMQGSRQMPAFGVALHNEVIEAKKLGVWLELKYDKTIVYDEMPFDRLLIEVGADYTGFNLMRYHDGQYEGRCYYVDLVENNMQVLYDYLINV